MIPRVIEAEYLRDYTIHLRFADGTEGDVDLSQELYGEIFEPLKDIELFRCSLFIRNFILFAGQTVLT